MNIRIAEVRETFDPDRNGQMSCRIEGYGETLKSVQATTPWSSRGEAGFDGFIPERGQQILAVQPDGSSDWYMLNCIYSKEPNLTTGIMPAIENLAPPNRNMGDVLGGQVGAGTGRPGDKQQIQGPMGQGMAITSQRRPDAMDIKSELYSCTGKVTSLVDTPNIDSILLDTGSKSGTCKLRMTHAPVSDTLTHNTFKLDTTGPQKLFNHESQTDLIVWDGRELQFLNYSVGTNAPAGPGPWMNYWGNVNLQSRWNDINIFSKQPRLEAREEGKDGRIFLECLNTDGKEQVIQLRTRGANGSGNDEDSEKCVIRLHSSGKVEIKTGADFNVDIDCGGDINMKAAGKINITAGQEINILSKENNVNIDGNDEIWLNSGKADEANPEVNLDDSYYGGEGITTYS